MNVHRFELRAAAKRYGQCEALAGVSLTLAAGEHTALLGPSGCGKSTLLRLLAGLDAPSSGQVLLDGSLVSEADRVLLPPHRRGVAMVFQDLALWPNLSVIENVMLGQVYATGSTRAARARATEVLARCRIADLADRLPGTLSGGEQQRVALARAVAARPVFLFLDEPFTAVDLVTRTELLAEVAVLAREQSLTLVLVAHEPIDVMALCTSAVVLRDGQVEESGALAELLHDPRSTFLRAFRDRLPGRR